MTKEFNYTYLGENGVLTTPIFLPNVPCIKKVILKADSGKKLQKENITTNTVTVLESEVEDWIEVEI